MLGMLEFPIDPEVRIRGTPDRVLRCTSDAVKFLRQMSLGRTDGPWPRLLQAFQDARDEWTAMETVVQLELALEAEGRLIEETSSLQSQDTSLAESA
jgi:hypothetical protein